MVGYDYQILKIIKFEEDRVKVIIHGKTGYIKYNENYSVESSRVRFDSINYKYTIKIKK